MQLISVGNSPIARKGLGLIGKSWVAFDVEAAYQGPALVAFRARYFQVFFRHDIAPNRQGLTPSIEARDIIRIAAERVRSAHDFRTEHRELLRIACYGLFRRNSQFTQI